jgi:hypothetical protein
MAPGAFVRVPSRENDSGVGCDRHGISVGGGTIL